MSGFDDEFLRRIDGRHYILGGEDGHTPVKVSLLDYARWFQVHDKNRVVGQTDLEFVFISTVFLGLDHRYWGSGPPILFESMAFSKETHTVDFGDRNPFEAHEDFEQIRYATWDDAAAGHETMVRRWQKKEDDARKAVADGRLAKIRKRLKQQDENGGGR